MRLPSSPKSGAPAGVFMASVLQLDDELVVRNGADVASDLDAAAFHEHGLARGDLALEVRRERARAVGLLHRRDAITVEDHEDVVELVLVDVAVGPRWEVQLPDPHPVVLEHDRVAHGSEASIQGHGSLVAHDAFLIFSLSRYGSSVAGDAPQTELHQVVGLGGGGSRAVK